MVNVFETTFLMSVRGTAASLFAVYAAALFAEGIFPLRLLSWIEPRGFALRPDRDFDLESDDDFDLDSEASVRLRFL